MFEVADSIDGIISIAGGFYAYLAAIGKIKISKTDERSRGSGVEGQVLQLTLCKM